MPLASNYGPGAIANGIAAPTAPYKNGAAADPHRLAPPDISAHDGNNEALMQENASKLVTYALQKTDGNKSKAAAMLGIKWGKLDYQMKELGIQKKTGA
ncbi:MAG: helix-turn-helix domain-containing protein [Leptospirales bacterium]